MEFRPLVPDTGFRRPDKDDPRARKPKADEADYAEKLKAHNAFLMERDVYLELGYVRNDFSFLCTVITEAYGPNFFSHITRHSQNIELRMKYRIVSAEGYHLYDSTLREAFNAPYILASLERALSETQDQDKDFKSAFGRKAKSDLIAYESLKAKREAELEELTCGRSRTSPWRSSLTSFRNLESKMEEPVPMDTAEARQENATSSAVDAETGDLPQGKMPDTAETTTPDVPMETEAPESSPQGEVSGVKVETAEGSLQGEGSATVDDAMGVAEEVKEEEVDFDADDDEVMPPDISPEKDTGL